jgi:hypothetical protein
MYLCTIEFAFVLSLMESTMKSILRSLAVLAVLVGFSSSAFAQDDANIIRPITKQGSAAFMFTINGLGTFGLGAPSFNPGLDAAGFGFKYFLADDVALRVLLGFNSKSVDTPETSHTMFGVGVGAEYHFRPLYSTSPYIGAQIGFQSTSDESVQNILGTEVTSTTTASKFNFSAFAGFDWFFTRGIAAGAEFGLGFTSESSSSEASGGGNSQESDGPATTTIALNSAGNVHLVVYF